MQQQDPFPCEFTEDHLILDKVPGFPHPETYAPQSSDAYSTRGNMHNGQLKLLISEIEFLVSAHKQRLAEYPDTDVDAPFFCVYVGAFVGTHLYSLMAMFPNVRWLLVDPSFGKESANRMKETWLAKRVTVYGKEFTSDDVELINCWRRLPVATATGPIQRVCKTEWKGLIEKLNLLELGTWNQDRDLLFISDIRSYAVDEAYIEKEMDDQAFWFNRLEASTGLLKFRLPYITKEWLYNRPADDRKRLYISGDIHMPVYGASSTTECRLLVKKNNHSIYYDPVLHEKKFAGFNQHERAWLYRYKGDLYKSFDRVAIKAVTNKFFEFLETCVGLGPSRNCRPRWEACWRITESVSTWPKSQSA